MYILILLYNVIIHNDIQPCKADQTRQPDGSCQWNPCVNKEQTRNNEGQCVWEKCQYPEQTRNAQGVCEWPQISCVQPSNYRVTLPTGQPICRECQAGYQGNNAELNKKNPNNPTENTSCVKLPTPLDKCLAGQYIDPKSGLCAWPTTLCQNQFDAPTKLSNGATVCTLCGNNLEGNSAAQIRSGAQGWFNDKCVPSNMFANKCTGRTCDVEGQICLPGTEGSSDSAWICKNKQWVQAPSEVGNLLNVSYPSTNYEVKQWSGPAPSSCPQFTNSLVSQDCYNQMWQQIGCSGVAPAMNAMQKVMPQSALFNQMRQVCNK